MQTEMVDARRSLWVCVLQLHESVFADLDINQRYLTLLVRVPECLREAHRLRVVRHCLVEIRDAERHMIEANDSTIRTLGNGLDGQAHYNSADEQKKTPHEETPFSIRMALFRSKLLYIRFKGIVHFDRPLLVPLAHHGLRH